MRRDAGPPAPRLHPPSAPTDGAGALSRASRALPLLLAGCGLTASGDKLESAPPDSAAVACPVAVVDPPSIAWTRRALGSEASEGVTVRNDCAGSEPLTLQASVDHAAFTVDPAELVVAPGDLALLTVRATVSRYQEEVGVLTLATNDPALPVIAVALSALAAPDQDGDGHDAVEAGGDDCDDGDPVISGAVSEVWYDGVDQNCDGRDDDQDGDGFLLAEDCDDTEPTAHPGGVETWYDGIDQDCDGNDADQDGDGSDLAFDCDDTDAAVHPGADETWYDGIDQDCDDNDADQDGDGSIRSRDCDDTDRGRYPGAPDAWYDGIDSDCAGDNDYDQDGDGHDAAVDCDDTDASANPAATETWYDGIDQDCDGNDDDQDGDGAGIALDCDDADASRYPGAAETWYDGVDTDCGGGSDFDRDADGFDRGADCDDADATVNRGAAEVWYDGVDQDCDGNDDDQDGDGVGLALDCDDVDPAVFPGAPDAWYDGVDSDCGGEDDLDQDGDGAPLPADCDDLDPAVSPGAVEVCDGADVDEDCSGTAEDVDGGATWYLDADGDGQGSPATAFSWCDPPSGYVLDGSDCLDSDATIRTGGVDVCEDGVDQDCSGADQACPFGGSYDADIGYDVEIQGEATGDELGGILLAGDFDGDGLGDLVVGAVRGTYGSADGVIYAFYGPMAPGSSQASVAADVAWYNSSSSWWGYWPMGLSELGDLDGDGVDDLGVTTGMSASDAYAFYGGATGVVADTAYDLSLGSCGPLARAGNFDGSGTAAWLCGLTAEIRGGAAVYRGTDTSSPLAELTGESGPDEAGTSVAGGGDVDGDGLDDLWIGAPGDDDGGNNAGASYLVFAPVSGTVVLSDADAKILGAVGDDFGTLVRMPGDVDGDGHADVMGVAVDAASGAGAAYLFTGARAGLGTADADATLVGEDAWNGVGRYDLETGDVNGDGAVDVLLASPDNDDAGADAGAAWLTLGPLAGTRTLGTDSDAEWLGASAGDGLGQAIAIIPDWDGDGNDEIAMGASRGDGDAADAGGVWVWGGR